MGNRFKLSREKGAVEERRVANLYKDLGFTEAKRNLSQYQKIDGRDLSGTAPFCVQIKKGKSPSPIKAYKEAVDGMDCKHNKAVAHVNYDNGPNLVIMSEETFIYLVRQGLK